MARSPRAAGQAAAFLVLLGVALGLAASGCAVLTSGEEDSFDVVVYGGTSAGVTAAVQAARMGRSVVLVEPTGHLGGLSSGGLGATDIGNKGAIGGLSREFYRRVWKHYGDADAWTREERNAYAHTAHWDPDETWWKFEPHVAEKVFGDMVREAGVTVVLGERLDLAAGVAMDGRRIAAVAMESGRTFRGTMFVDATYEGDLMACAGVSCTVGREGNAQYGETLNGVQTARARYHQFDVPVDPYVRPGDPASGLLPGVHPGGPGEEGAGDRRVQAYNFRMCLTDVPENRVPFPRPDGYDPLRYELLLRALLAGWEDVFSHHQMMPNRKTDTNNKGCFSTDNIGMNYGYPEGDHAERAAITAEHETYQKGLMWFLASDPRVPEKVRADVARWGLAADEFVDNGNWPRQIYVREARRMVGDYVMTEHDCRGTRRAPDPVGLGAYGMDSHHTQRYVDENGLARNEGDIQVHGFQPYPISFRSIVPRRGECENLLVPVCVSASHIAFGSIRMEPVFMILGQSAATAAALAVDEGVPVQEVDYERLRARLLADGQRLQWPVDGAAGTPVKELEGIVVDDAEAVLTGAWLISTSVPAFVESGYRHDDDAAKGTKSARFEVAVRASGDYDVQIAYAPHANRAARVPVSVEHAEGSSRVYVDQRAAPPIDRLFVSIGTFRFEAGRPAVIEVSNAGTDGFVIVDAVRLVRCR